MSSILRIVIGAALIVGGGVVYTRNRSQIAAGGQVHIFGVSAGGTGWLVPTFIAVGVIGLVFVAAGIAGLLKNRR